MELTLIIIVSVAAIAAVIDTRTGLIPNWLTFPTIAFGPIYWAFHSPDHLLQSLLGMIVVGLIPAMMFYIGAGMGGGDVKLFAGFGGIAWVKLGLEILMYSMMAGMFVALIWMAYQGQLTVVLKNVGKMLITPFLPKSHRKPLESKQMHKMRLGISIFLGTAIAVIHATGLL